MIAKNCNLENNIIVAPKNLIVKSFWDIDREHVALQNFSPDLVKL
jgi:hypothetical protein